MKKTVKNHLKKDSKDFKEIKEESKEIGNKVKKLQARDTKEKMMNKKMCAKKKK